MSLFHRHKWSEQGRTYNASHQDQQIAYVIDREDAKLLYGFTIVELRCELCGDIKTVSVAGRCE